MELFANVARVFLFAVPLGVAVAVFVTSLLRLWRRNHGQWRIPLALVLGLFAGQTALGAYFVTVDPIMIALGQFGAPFGVNQAILYVSVLLVSLRITLAIIRLIRGTDDPVVFHRDLRNFFQLAFYLAVVGSLVVHTKSIVEEGLFPFFMITNWALFYVLDDWIIMHGYAAKLGVPLIAAHQVKRLGFNALLLVTSMLSVVFDAFLAGGLQFVTIPLFAVLVGGSFAMTLVYREVRPADTPEASANT